MAKLIYEDPELGEQVVVELSYELPEVTVGRNPGNIIRINNPSISRRHTKFVFEAGRCTLYDLESSNGTYVNGIRIMSQVLNDGDRVRVGEFPLDFAEHLAGANSAQSRNPTSMGLGHREGQFEAPGLFGNYDQPGLDQVTGAAISSSSAHWGPEPDEEEDAMALILDDEDFDELEPEEMVPELELDPISYGAQSISFVEEQRDDTVDASADDIAASIASLKMDMANDAPNYAGFGADLDDDEQDEGGEHMLSLNGWDEPASADLSQLNGELEALRSHAARLEQDNQELSQALEKIEGGGPVGGNPQVDRMRKERDRLAEERRNLMRQLADVKQQLDEAPSAELLVQLQEDLASTQEQLGVRDSQLETAYATVSEQESAIEGLQESNESLTGELAQLRSRYAQTEQERAAGDNQRSQLGDQLSDMQESLQNFEQSYNTARETIGRLEEEAHASYQEIGALRQTIEQHEENIVELNTNIDQRDKDIEQSDERIETMLASIETLTNERNAAQLRADELQTELASRPRLDELDGLQANLGQINADLTQVRAERDRLQRERDELEASLGQTRQVLSDLQARFDKIGGERDELRRERDGLKQEKAAFARETDYLQVERRKYVDQINDLTARVETLDKDRKRKKQVFEELSRDLRGLIEENNKHHETIAKLQESLAQAPKLDQLSDLEALIEDLNREIEETQAQLSELEGDSTRLTRELGQIADERDQLAERLESVDEELVTLRAAAEDTTLQETIVALEAAKETLTEERDALEAAQEGLAEQLEQAGSERDSLSTQVSALEAAAEARQEELDGLTAASESSREALEALTAEHEALNTRREELEAKLAESEQLASSAAKLQDEKAALETTLAELIMEKDKLEDQLRKK
ncbi:MAG: FHA domain-containing protein [Bradymonadaceae bacterium]|nr:FHA domain-containing protein [Lujinxingiaceae bacterium]